MRHYYPTKSKLKILLSAIAAISVAALISAFILWQGPSVDDSRIMDAIFSDAVEVNIQTKNSIILPQDMEYKLTEKMAIDGLKRSIMPAKLFSGQFRESDIFCTITVVCPDGQYDMELINTGKNSMCFRFRGSIYISLSSVRDGGIEVENYLYAYFYKQ
jgi:hypothetical protein